MGDTEGRGRIVVLNGTPRSGKSSVVAAIQETFEGPWLNLGVDVFVRHVTPDRLRPDTSLLSPHECAEAIWSRMADGAAPSAFQWLARMDA